MTNYLFYQCGEHSYVAETDSDVDNDIVFATFGEAKATLLTYLRNRRDIYAEATRLAVRLKKNDL